MIFDKLFGNTKISYKKVVVFAVIIGIYTGLINSITFLRNTSFQDIAISFEWWILFAIIIVVNQDNIKDACLKTFIFFLISQPIVYLVEVPFSSEGFSIFRHYINWGIWTLLTLPGSIICYQLKKKNIISVIVFAIVSIYFGYMCATFSKSIIYNFPYHCLSLFFIYAIAIGLPLILFDNRTYRIILIAIFLISYIVFGALAFKNSKTTIQLNSDAKYTYTIDDNDIVNVELTENNELILKSKNNGYTYINVKDQEGNNIEYMVTVTSGNIFVNSIN